jgi:hypothetical protein
MFPFTLREHGVPFFVAAPQMYAVSTVSSRPLGGTFAGSVARARGGVCSRAVFDIGAAGSAGRFATLRTAAVFCSRIGLLAARSGWLPPEKSLTTPNAQITDASSITPFNPYS